MGITIDNSKKNPSITFDNTSIKDFAELYYKITLYKICYLMQCDFITAKSIYMSNDIKKIHKFCQNPLSLQEQSKGGK